MRTLLLLCALIVLAPAHVHAASDAAAVRAEAETAFVRSRLATADRAYASLLARDAKDTLALIRRGQIALFENRLAEAKPWITRARAAGATPARTAAMLAEIAYRQDDYTTAAPLVRASGHEAKARKLEALASLKPWRIEGPDSAAIPMLQSDPLPVVSAMIDGHGPYLFLIDTGGGELAIDPSIADSLGLERFGEEMGTFAGGNRSGVQQSRIHTFGLGPLTLHDLPVGLVDTKRFSRIANGKPIAGIIGTVLFYHFRTTLDYPRKQLVLERRGHATSTPFASSAHAIEVPFIMAGDHFILASGTVDSSSAESWFIDSGLAGAAFTAPASTLLEGGIPVPDTSVGFVGQGGGGSVKAMPFRVRRITVGAAESNDLLGIFGAFPPTLERGLGVRIAGIVSHAFLRAWAVTFDFDRMRLVFTPPRE